MEAALFSIFHISLLTNHFPFFIFHLYTMGFIENNLSTNERIVYKAHLHWFAFMGGICLLFFIWLIAVGICLYNHLDWWIPTLVTAVILIVGYIYITLVMKNTEYYITNRRLIVKRGILERQTTELRLSKCEGVIVNQSMLGRLFNYGTISITTGEVVNDYKFLARPIKFRTMINEVLDLNQDDENKQ